MIRRPTRLLLTLGIWLVLVAGCTSSSGPEVVPATNVGPPATVAVIGGSEADGDDLADPLRDLWARQVFDGLPASTVYVNLASPDATAGDAAHAQVPDAVDLDPDIVLVWLTEADAVAATPADRYRDDLTGVIEAFGADTDVLLLRGEDDSSPGPGSAEGEVVAEVAGATGATLVDVSDVDGPTPDAQEQIAKRALEAIRTLDGGG